VKVRVVKSHPIFVAEFRVRFPSTADNFREMLRFRNHSAERIGCVVQMLKRPQQVLSIRLPDLYCQIE
jgi:hypothetical protein